MDGSSPNQGFAKKLTVVWHENGQIRHYKTFGLVDPLLWLCRPLDPTRVAQTSNICRPVGCRPDDQSAMMLC